VRTELAGNVIKVNLATKDGSILIGRKGEILEALQHIVNRMMNRGGRELPFVLLDVENYRERRHAHLEREAKSAANKVVETGKEIVLEPMPAGDRKIIHNFLKSLEGVRTYSRGREGERQVIVALEQKEATDLLEPSGNTD
jgi:spoIIIJ-associated protein